MTGSTSGAAGTGDSLIPPSDDARRSTDRGPAFFVSARPTPMKQKWESITISLSVNMQHWSINSQHAGNLNTSDTTTWEQLKHLSPESTQQLCSKTVTF